MRTPNHFIGIGAHILNILLSLGCVGSCTKGKDSIIVLLLAFSPYLFQAF